MTPIRLRLLVVTFLGVAAAISINALYMQDASRLAVAASTGEQTDAQAAPKSENKPEAALNPAPVEVAVLPKPAEEIPAEPELAPSLPLDKTPVRQPSEIDAALETVASLGSDTTPKLSGRSEAVAEEAQDAPPSPRVIRAIRRELNFHRYQAGPEDGEVTPEMQAAIVSYEFDMGLRLTGRASNALLKSLLFEASTALPPPSARAHFENSQKLITAVQDVLSRMGYGASASSGYLDEATRYAISKFEADRNMDESGRLTARLLLEIMIVTGEPIAIPG
jgi:peptidoglycan hydrolase-like protein with peptidoglycan-binding domain